MNILLVTHIYPDAINKWRGVFVREQALALSVENNVTVVFFRMDYSVFSPFGKYSFTENISGKLTEYEVTVPGTLPVINQLKYFRQTYRFIKKNVLRKQRPDVIHSHLSYPAGFFGTVIQRLTGIPNIVTEHSWVKKHFRSQVHKRCVMYALSNSKGYVTVSQALKDDISSYHKRNIAVIPNVINTGNFRISGAKPCKIFNIGLLGGLSNYRKGLDILIEAVSMIKDTEVYVHVGGSGALLDEFIQLAGQLGVSEKFRFHGEIPAEALAGFYSRLNAFVLASRDETFGVVIIEAMASGLPVIATDCGGPREIITNETGILVEKENPWKLAEAISYMARNLQLFDPEKISKYARDKYGYESFSSKMTELYREVINDPS